jgi:LPS O-antigen subunit length determinant protein (WzzB/FepE family)
MSDKSIQYLKEQINKTSELDVRKVLYGLIETELQSQKMAYVRDQYAYKVIDAAYVPTQRFSPVRRKMVSLGAISGFFFGTFLVLFINFIQVNRSLFKSK